MKIWIWNLILFSTLCLMVGCSYSVDCMPCREKPSPKTFYGEEGEGFRGFRYWSGSVNGMTARSHCAPCDKAVTKEEQLACSGYLPTIEKSWVAGGGGAYIKGLTSTTRCCGQGAGGGHHE